MASYATPLVLLGIVGLFRLDRQYGWTSKAIYIPFCWLLISMSRPVTAWLSSPATTADRMTSYVEGSPIDRTILMVLLALAIVALWRRKEATAAILSKNAPIILFFLYCLISASWADFPIVSLKRWIRAVGDVLMILVILTEKDPETALKSIVSRAGYVLVPLSILFIRFFPELGRAYSIGGRAMWTGVCTDKNALGALVMLVGAVTLWRIQDLRANPRNESQRGPMIALTAVFLMAVYLMSLVDSKTAQMCFVFATIILIFKSLFRRPWVIFSFTVGTVAACYAVLIAGASGDALEAIGRDESLTGRTRVWVQVLRYAVDPWVGSGYENFWIGDRLIALSGWGGNQAHNGYIEIYVNLGWVGLFFLGVVIVAGYATIIAFLKRNPELGRLKVAFFVICLVYNFSEAAFKMMSPVWMLFLWATMSTPVPATMPVPELPVPDPQQRRLNRFVPSRLAPAVGVEPASVSRTTRSAPAHDYSAGRRGSLLPR
jgi:exopolysaccharide production protein ExoQ